MPAEREGDQPDAVPGPGECPVIARRAGGTGGPGDRLGITRLHRAEPGQLHGGERRDPPVSRRVGALPGRLEEAPGLGRAAVKQREMPVQVDRPRLASLQVGAQVAASPRAAATQPARTSASSASSRQSRPARGSELSRAASRK